MKSHGKTKNINKGYPHGHPLRGYPGPDPATVALCMPIGDFKPDIECVHGMMQCAPFYKRPMNWCGCSAVNEARNRIAHNFLNAPEQFEWAVWVDSDIGFKAQDWIYLIEGDDPFVIAPYSKKSLEGVRVETGFGFVKVHRKVFQAIHDLVDDEGRERALRFFLNGELMVDYFPCGATGNGNFLGEDDGFIMWAGLAGFTPRIEERCELVHYGRHGFRLRRGTVSETGPTASARDALNR